jgi:hypothetical protein
VVKLKLVEKLNFFGAKLSVVDRNCAAKEKRLLLCSIVQGTGRMVNHPQRRSSNEMMRLGASKLLFIRLVETPYQIARTNRRHPHSVMGAILVPVGQVNNPLMNV